MEATAIVTAIGIGIGLLVAMLGGFWTVLSTISSRFAAVDRELKDMKEKNATTVAQLQVNEAIQATRLDSLEGMVKMFPAIFQSSYQQKPPEKSGS